MTIDHIDPRRYQTNRAQPLVDRSTRVFGVKETATVRVKIKASGVEAVINESDFDPARHERVES